MTKRESAEYVLQYGHCAGVPCVYCFVCKDSLGVDLCRFLTMGNDSFRAKAIAAKYLGSLDGEEEGIIGE